MKRQNSDKTGTNKAKSQGKLGLKRNTLLDMSVKNDVRGGKKSISVQ